MCSFGVLKVCFAPFVVSVERVFCVPVGHNLEACAGGTLYSPPFIISVECVLGVAISEVGERVSACVFQFSSAVKHFVVYYDVLAPVVSIVLFVPVVAAFLYGGCRSSVLAADVRGGGWQRY